MRLTRPRDAAAGLSGRSAQPQRYGDNWASGDVVGSTPLGTGWRARCARSAVLRLARAGSDGGPASSSSVKDAHSNKSPQQAADALYNATQQPEDAGQQAPYGAAEAAKNSHPNSSRTAGFKYPRHSSGHLSARPTKPGGRQLVSMHTCR